MRSGLSMRSRAEVTSRYARAYVRASKKDKGRVPDQAVAVTGWSRDNARRRLVAAAPNRDPKGRPHRQGRPRRLEPAPAGLGRRPRIRLGHQQGLPDPGRPALLPRRESAPHQHRGRRRVRTPRSAPHRRGEPAGQGDPRRPRRGNGDGDGGARAQRFVVCTNPRPPSATPPCGRTWSSTSPD